MSEQEEDVGPLIPEDYDEMIAAKDTDPQDHQNTLMTTYRRPRRTKQNVDEKLHPIDEKKLLT